jgi:cobalamin 5'-phosphate synthase/cobalamin synthase
VRASRSSVGAGWFAAAVAAFQFLTRLPVPVRVEYTETVFRRSAVFFPLVGFALGIVLSAAGWFLLRIVPAAPAAAVLLCLWVALTGGLHLDGLMDTADGLLSHRSRERMLEIMKDSRVGAMGVMACVLVLVTKGALLFSMMELSWSRSLWLIPLVMLWSRWMMAAAIAGWPYARPEQGLGALFKGVTLRHAAAGAALSALLTVGLWALWAGLQAPSASAAAMVASFVLPPVSAAVVGCGLAAFFHRKLGGLTGDTYGAINELTEAAQLFVIVVCL